MAYLIRGLDPAPFRPLYGLSDAELASRGAMRMIADAQPGFPCRVGLDDPAVGTPMLLVNYEHLPVATPYRSSYAVFVREGADRAAAYENEVPEQLAIRLISLRAFDSAGMLRKAEVLDGTELAPLIEAWLGDPGIAFLHAHNARPGCFAARIDRA